MKKIKISGKLNLNKEVITKLNDEQMKDVKGGLPYHNTLSFTRNCSQEYAGCEDGEISWGLFCRDNGMPRID